MWYGILDGDLLLVDRAAKPVNGSVFVVAVNGEYTVKRLCREPERISANHDFLTLKPLKDLDPRDGTVDT